MATYYWLGITGACGNVNNSANWTLWSPQGLCAFLPPSASSIPKYNDTIVFTRFNVSGVCYGVNYYPQVAPQGQLDAAAGYTYQYLQTLRVEGNCPVGLGSSANPFSVRAVNVDLGLCGGNTEIAGKPTYLNLRQSNGSVPGGIDALVNISSQSPVDYEYNITGVARNIQIDPNQQFHRATVNLKNIEFTRNASWNIQSFLFNSSAPASSLVINVDSTVTGYNGIQVTRPGTVVNIARGYSTQLDISQINVASTNPSVTSPVINFAEVGYSGACGPTETSRTYIDRLVVVSGNNTAPKINFKHGVDVVKLEASAGEIKFEQTTGLSDSSIIQKGFMVANNCSMYLNRDSVNIGSNGEFVIINGSQDSQLIPQIYLNGGGYWNLDIAPTGTTS